MLVIGLISIKAVNGFSIPVDQQKMGEASS